jgi:hypothetical protein
MLVRPAARSVWLRIEQTRSDLPSYDSSIAITENHRSRQPGMPPGRGTGLLRLQLLGDVRERAARRGVSVPPHWRHLIRPITVAGVDVVEVELVRIERGGGHPLRVTKTSNRASATSFKYAAARLTAVLEPRRSARRGALVDDRELGKLLVIEVGVRRSSSSVQARRVVDSRARVA